MADEPAGGAEDVPRPGAHAQRAQHTQRDGTAGPEPYAEDDPAPPAAEHPMARPEVLAAVRDLLRVESANEAVDVLRNTISALGGEPVPADEAPRDSIPVDVSLGMGEPTVVAATSAGGVREELETVLPALVEDARAAARRAERVARLVSQARTDPLTGLANRRSFDALRRSTAPATVAVLDLDHFKQVNDAFGHDEGDRVLVAFSRAMRDNLRSTDMVFRIGGEEFVLVFPATTPSETMTILEHLREGWQRRRPRAVTFSAGVASIVDGQLLKAVGAADLALLDAKDAGRDRFVVVDSPAARRVGRLTFLRPHVPRPSAARALREVVAADRDAIFAECRNLLESGVAASAVIDEHLAPAMQTVGELWEVGLATVSDEHRLTAFVDHAVGAIPPASERGGTVTIASVDGEWHVLPAKMLGAVLENSGWRCNYLGASTGRRRLTSSLSRQRPDAVMLSCTMPCNLGGLAEALHAARPFDIPVYVGGYGLGTDGRRAEEIGADGWGLDTAGALNLLGTRPRRRDIDGERWSDRLRSYRRDLAQTSQWLSRVTPVDGWADMAHLLRVVSVAALLADPGLVVEHVDWLGSLEAGRTAGLDVLADNIDRILGRTRSKNGSLATMLATAATALAARRADRYFGELAGDDHRYRVPHADASTTDRPRRDLRAPMAGALPRDSPAPPAELRAHVDRTGRLADVSRDLAHLLGMASRDLTGAALVDLVHDDDRAALMDAMVECATTPGAGVALRFRVRPVQGLGPWRVLDVLMSYRRGDEQSGGIFVDARDVTALVEAERLQTEEAALAARIAADDDVATLIADLARAVRGDTDGVEVHFTFDDAWFTWGEAPPEASTIERDPVTSAGHAVGTMFVTGAAGRRAHLDPLRRSLGLSLAALIAQREISRQLLVYGATHDQLTGLANRALLASRIDTALATPGCNPSLLVVAVDHFRQVNDRTGIAAGDDLLRELAIRLWTLADRDDTVARLGGDEFALLVDCAAGDRDLGKLGADALIAMQRPIVTGAATVEITASIGLTDSSTHFESSDDMIAAAVAALATAKHAGRNRIAVFGESERQRLAHQLAFDNELRAAVAHEELTYDLQPIVDLTTGAVVGAEALVRWQHPQRGLLQPDDFVPEAEEHGLIRLVDTWMLEQVCHFLRSHQVRPGFSISVNASVHELTAAGFPATVIEALGAEGLSPASLAIEVTESVALGNPTAVQSNLADLRDVGVAIHLDDFGTGYSALGSLRHLPVDALKIDRSFVGSMEADPAMEALVRAITAMASAFSLECIAEGIETAAQRDALQALGVQWAQGYFFGAPIPADEFARRHLAATV